MADIHYRKFTTSGCIVSPPNTVSVTALPCKTQSHVCTKVNVNKVVIKILQGSVVTQTTLGGITMHPLLVNFLWCICAKSYDSWMAVDKVIANNQGAYCFWPILYNLSMLCIDLIYFGGTMAVNLHP